MSYYTEKNRKKRPKSLHWLENKSKKPQKARKQGAKDTQNP